MSELRITCPNCRARTGVALVPAPIGMSGIDELLAAQARGEVVLTGCVIDDRTHGCPACGARWTAGDEAATLTVTPPPPAPPPL